MKKIKFLPLVALVIAMIAAFATQASKAHTGLTPDRYNTISGCEVCEEIAPGVEFECTTESEGAVGPCECEYDIDQDSDLDIVHASTNDAQCNLLYKHEL